MTNSRHSRFPDTPSFLYHLEIYAYSLLGFSNYARRSSSDPLKRFCF